jgi:asparagine synthase (glutamine-hydrolysing)
LLLARDHAAIKPLYFLRHRDGLLFASQYDQITAHPWARELRIRDGALALYLTLGYIPPPFALLESSGALEAGAWMSVDLGGQTHYGRHFSFPQNPAPELFGEAALEAVDAAVESAVRRQIVSDVPIGVLLSGGIDSPLVAAKMRQASNGPIPAFTLSAGGNEMDESADAHRYAEALGLSHEIRRIENPDILELLDEVVTAYSEPHDDYSIFPTALISRVARQKVTVALSGDGGDDWFWGYPERMIQPLNGTPSAAPSRLSSLLGRARPQPGEPARLPNAQQTGLDQLRRHRFVDPGQLAAIFPDLPSFPEEFSLFSYPGGSRDDLARWLRWNEYTGHLGRVLQKVDRASMHYSLEVRVPLLDREVVDVAARVDWRSAVDLARGIGKLPLRSALQRRTGFQTLRKRGFTVPMAAWLRGPLCALFEDKVLSRADLLGLPMDVNQVARLFRRHRMRLLDAHWLLWRLLSLALWDDRHYPGARAAAA